MKRSDSKHHRVEWEEKVKTRTDIICNIHVFVLQSMIDRYLKYPESLRLAILNSNNALGI